MCGCDQLLITFAAKHYYIIILSTQNPFSPLLHSVGIYSFRLKVLRAFATFATCSSSTLFCIFASRSNELDKLICIISESKWIIYGLYRSNHGVAVSLNFMYAIWEFGTYKMHTRMIWYMESRCNWLQSMIKLLCYLLALENFQMFPFHPWYLIDLKRFQPNVCVFVIHIECVLFLAKAYNFIAFNTHKKKTENMIFVSQRTIWRRAINMELLVMRFEHKQKFDFIRKKGVIFWTVWQTYIDNLIINFHKSSDFSRKTNKTTINTKRKRAKFSFQYSQFTFVKWWIRWIPCGITMVQQKISLSKCSVNAIR